MTSNYNNENIDTWVLDHLVIFSDSIIALKSFHKYIAKEIVNKTKLLHEMEIFNFLALPKEKNLDFHADLAEVSTLKEFLRMVPYIDPQHLKRPTNNDHYKANKEITISDTPIDYINIYTRCWQDNPIINKYFSI
ncbi:hypothetical protein C1645_832840 [Glomus cerebriforme]|uniref:Uncharacterized protein n=1 Tax=Glomus cerebriforme TaxID=658196 RepID=A0A397SJ90_9GLOM|nr:hypothetical protein C1645_832840 [Glomus cerebriforme]